MPHTLKYNLEFRPVYWQNLNQELISQIKGEIRQQIAFNNQDPMIFENLPSDILDSALRQNRILGYAVNGSEFLGGEHLPDYLDGEVEIARIIMYNANLDVTSIRARRVDSEIHYRIVDEYETIFVGFLLISYEPFTFEEIVDHLKYLRSIDEPQKPLTNGFDYFSDISWADNLEEIRDYIEVRSLFYPELNQWFKEEAHEAMLMHKSKPS